MSGLAVAVGLALAGVGLLAHLVRRQSAAGGSLIPSPFPFWHDIVVSVTLNGKLPDAVELHRKWGPLFWWRFLGRRMLMVGGFEQLNQVMKGEHDTVEADYPTSVKHLIGPWGISNLYGSDHMKIKRLVQAAFTPKAIRGYLPRLQATAEEAVRKWAAQGDIFAYTEIKWYTFRVAVDCIVGFDESWTSPEGFPVVSALFRDWLEGLFSLPIAIPGTAFSRGMKARAGLMKHIHASLDVLEEKRKQGAAETDASKHKTALDLLLAARDEDGEGLTRDQIADNVLTLLFAGHDTSATTLTRLLQNLHAHPEVMQRLREEQAEILAKHGSELTQEALDDMRYADAVARETLRFKPVIAGFPRVALKDFELAGHTIKKGTHMQCSIDQTVRADPRWVGDALEFKPERWLTEAGQKNGAWIPFGGGPRLCLGWLLAMAEIKALLAVISRGYSIQLKDPEEPWALFPLARPKNGMPARFEAIA